MGMDVSMDILRQCNIVTGARIVLHNTLNQGPEPCGLALKFLKIFLKFVCVFLLFMADNEIIVW